MDNQTPSGKPLQGRLMHYGMMACCAVMLLPIVGFFISGGTLAGLWGNAAAFAPLLLCVGAHLVMHKAMGKSCHDRSKAAETEEDLPAEAVAEQNVLGRKAG
ncbi:MULTISPECIES: DUF2933 domain-containing protein [Mameliella]|uniref:DUF2933 domain-containing protein n=1 Tax=Mameliella TaxID=1434019 RepID=UPI000B538C44|nr:MULTISPECIES: DUF2933 domain-containing protein [Mameliella]OWV40303.1 DUF2933 domain-containing protein [Mameliella alba]OWV58855.1 DUF2933 domain-containing protein [Mameliella alba]